MNPRRRRAAHITLTLLGVPGLPALFLPFAWGTSPYEALLDLDLLRLAFPAFLVVFILPALKRWLGSGALSRQAELTGYGLAAAGAALVLFSYTKFRAWPDGPLEWVATVGPLLTLGVGARFLVQTLRDGGARGYAPILALQTVYLANGILALGALYRDLQIGAYCILVTMLAYAFQIDLVRRVPAEPTAP